MRKVMIGVLVVFGLVLSAHAEAKGKHLFILTGQSNMGGIKPEVSFTPTVAEAFGKDNVIIRKLNRGGQSIRQWYRKWKAADGTTIENCGQLFDKLIRNVHAAIEGEQIATVTFIWMQGESDALKGYGEVYAASFKGILAQLEAELKRSDINFVIGRLSDSRKHIKKFPHWMMIREAQVKLAEESPRGDWIDTDAMNDGINKGGKKIKDALHMSVEGYKQMGKAFAEKAIALIKKHAKK